MYRVMGAQNNNCIDYILYIHLIAGIGSIISEVVSSIGNYFMYVIKIIFFLTHNKCCATL